MEKSKDTEVKIKTLFQQKENELKEKDAKIVDLEKKVRISLFLQKSVALVKKSRRDD